MELREAAQDPGRLVAEAASTGAGRGAPRTAGCRASGRGCARGSRDPRPGRAARRGRCGDRARRRAWARALSRSRWNSAGHSKRRGSRLAAPFSSITGVPAGISTPPIVVERRARRKSVFTGLSTRSTSSRKAGIRSRSARSSSCSSGCSASSFSAPGEQAGGGLLAGREQERRRPHDRGHLGRGPVRVGRQRQVGEHVGARLAPPVLDVLDEPLVEPRERVLTRVAFLAGADLAHGAGHAEALTEPRVVGFRHAEEVGDDEHRRTAGCTR